MLDKLRLHVASDRSGLIELSLLAILVGVISAAIVIAFRLIVEGLQEQFLPGANAENYEALPTWILFALPAVGGIVLGILFQALKPDQRPVGVVHTIERLDYHQGRLPLANFLAQFLGAAISILSGHSVGREGPSIHMGAAGGSLFGQWLKLPNNAIRILVACGVAAGIAASFNTPIAGIIFTVEVIMLEYISFSLLPIILSAVVATIMSQAVFGDEALLKIPHFEALTHTELVWVAITGIAIGFIGAAFIRLLLFVTRFSSKWPIWLRMTMAGAFTGCCAIIAPQIMSIGYDTVIDAMNNQFILATLVLIVLVKLAATSAGLGLGLPGGLIGPCVFLGATAGAAIGVFGVLIAPESISQPGVYALIGIGAMMAAVIQAPLAALITMFELTHDPQILLPGLLAVAVAQLTTSHVFKQKAVFRALLSARGLDYKNDPFSQTLRRVGVIKAMETSVIAIPAQTDRPHLEQQLTNNPRWVLVRDATESSLIPAVDVANFLSRNSEKDEIDLTAIPAQRLASQRISAQASLQDAYELIEESGYEAVYITAGKKDTTDLAGVLTEEDILAYNLPPSRRRMKPS